MQEQFPADRQGRWKCQKMQAGDCSGNASIPYMRVGQSSFGRAIDECLIELLLGALTCPAPNN